MQVVHVRLVPIGRLLIQELAQVDREGELVPVVDLHVSYTPVLPANEYAKPRLGAGTKR